MAARVERGKVQAMQWLAYMINNSKHKKQQS